MTEVETFFISFSFYGFYVASCCCCLFVCISNSPASLFLHCRNLSYYKWKNINHHAVIFFVCCVLFSDGFDFGEIHFLSCSIIHKIWWETFMKLIFIKLYALGERKRKKKEIFRKRKQHKNKKNITTFP